MKRRGMCCLLLMTLAFVASLEARADDRLYVPNPYSDSVWDIDLEQSEPGRTPPSWLTFEGQFRLRASMWSNLDLDRGPMPSGQWLGGSQPHDTTVSGMDMRLMVDPVIHAGPEVTIHARISALENLVLGSTPSAYPATPEIPLPAASSTQTEVRGGQNSLNDSISVTRLWLEWLSPVGMFFVGRMGVDWGLGMVGNSGNGADSDTQQVADVVGLATSFGNHVVAFSYSFDANGGHQGTQGYSNGVLFDLADSDDLRSLTLAVSKYDLPVVARRKAMEGRTVLQYGLSISWRSQDRDLPRYYIQDPEDWDGDAQPEEWVERGMNAVVLDGWARLWTTHVRLDAEAAWAWASMDNASMMAGVDMGRVTSNQWGMVVRATFIPVRPLSIRIEADLASGDSAYGFGVNTSGVTAPKPGDMDGAQADFVKDTNVNNFRFNSNYHVDEILWRRLVGTVSDAMVIRAGAEWEPAGWVKLDVTGVYSRVLEARSAPGLASDLGLEIDAGVTLLGTDGLFLRGVFALLIPLDGLRNVYDNVSAQPAWALRAVGGVRF